MTISFKPQDLHGNAKGTLELAAHNYFWTDGEWVQTLKGPMMKGQMYVEYWIPKELRHKTPIVMIHGGGGQGLDYIGTPDGREGWVHYFVRAGYAVYVVDRPMHGRAPYHPDAQGDLDFMAPNGVMIEHMFTRPGEITGNWPQAAGHTQWPGDGTREDPAMKSMFASLGPNPADLFEYQAQCQKAGAELLDKIGEAIIVSHSMGAIMGWLVADARPDLVKAVVAVEPIGPPFAPQFGPLLAWGLTAIPLTYDPPAKSPADIKLEQRPPAKPGTMPCMVQAEPARQLPNLSKMPIVVITAETSWMTMDNHGAVDFLAQAGANIEHLRLEDHDVKGNGHMVMAEKNSDDVAGVIEKWINGAAPS